MNIYLLKLVCSGNLRKETDEKQIMAVDIDAATIQANAIISGLSEYTVTTAQLVTVGSCAGLLV